MLDEIQAGIFDGWTYEQIEQQMPQEFVARKKDKLKYRCAFAPVCLVIVALPVCMCSSSFSACLWLIAYFWSASIHLLPSSSSSPPFLSSCALSVACILPVAQQHPSQVAADYLPKQATVMQQKKLNSQLLIFPLSLVQTLKIFVWSLCGGQVPKWGELPGCHSAPGACHH